MLPKVRTVKRGVSGRRGEFGQAPNEITFHFVFAISVHFFRFEAICQLEQHIGFKLNYNNIDKKVFADPEQSFIAPS